MIYPFGPKSEKTKILVDQNEDLDLLAKDLLEFLQIKEVLMDDKNLVVYANDALKDDKYFVVWFYNNSDNLNKLFIHTLSNQPRFRKYMNFGRYPDPDNSSMKIWNFNKVPYAITIMGNSEDQHSFKRAEYEPEDGVFIFSKIWSYL